MRAAKQIDQLDPSAAKPYRELMVSVWYPARDAGRYPLAPQMLPGAAAHYGSPDGWGKQGYNVPAGKVDWAATQTAGHVGAPVADGPARAAGPGLRRRGRQLPVVLYSPGAGVPPPRWRASSSSLLLAPPRRDAGAGR